MSWHDIYNHRLLGIQHSLVDPHIIRYGRSKHIQMRHYKVVTNLMGHHVRVSYRDTNLLRTGMTSPDFVKSNGKPSRSRKTHFITRTVTHESSPWIYWSSPYNTFVKVVTYYRECWPFKTIRFQVVWVGNWVIFVVKKWMLHVLSSVIPYLPLISTYTLS